MSGLKRAFALVCVIFMVLSLSSCAAAKLADSFNKEGA